MWTLRPVGPLPPHSGQRTFLRDLPDGCTHLRSQRRPQADVREGPWHLPPGRSAVFELVHKSLQGVKLGGELAQLLFQGVELPVKVVHCFWQGPDSGCTQRKLTKKNHSDESFIPPWLLKDLWGLQTLLNIPPNGTAACWQSPEEGRTESNWQPTWKSQHFVKQEQPRRETSGWQTQQLKSFRRWTDFWPQSGPQAKTCVRMKEIVASNTQQQDMRCQEVNDL